MVKLWNHQQQMVNFALKNKSVLWNVWMGGGKTLAGASVINEVGTPAVVFCPKAVIPVWQETLTKHFGLKVYSISELKGSNVAQKMLTMPKQLDGVFVLNYDVSHRDPVFKYLSKQNLKIIVADESQRIRKHSTKSSKALYNLGKSVEYRLCLTGTPTPNNPLDLFGQFRFLDDAVLGKYWTKFMSRYAHTYQLPGTSVKIVKSYRDLDDLAVKTNPYIYSLTLEDMMNDETLPDFPKVQHVRIPVKLPAKITKAMKALTDEFIAEIDEGFLTVDNVVAKIVRLSQLTSGLAVISNTENDDLDYRMIDTTKLDTLLDFLKDVPETEPVVIFARFRHEIDYLVERLSGGENEAGSVSELSGKANDLKSWQNGDTRFLIVQIDAGAEGIDLTRAHVGVFFSNTYDLGKYQQAVARLQRPNSQHNRVVYYHFVGEDTIDEVLYTALQKKEKVNQVFYNHLKG